MKWKKHGIICSHETLDLAWYRKNTMVPTPYLTAENALRIFLTFCDQDNIGRIGYIDTDPSDPKKILGYSSKPALDIGSKGTFDDHGVVTASVVKNGDELWLYYSGYQLGVSFPYTIFGGLATSRDEGRSFQRYSRVPILDRTEKEIHSRCGPIVSKDDSRFRLWYQGDLEDGWVDNHGKLQPRSVIKHLTSIDGIHWGQAEGAHCLHFKDREEHGLAKPTIWYERGRYRMIYSIRHLHKGYRLGYAESADGIVFERMDERIGLDLSAEGWDSEMICFGSLFRHHDRTYLFYCGNHYGLDGFGYAELVEDN